MCRWLAYTGDPIALSDLIFDTEHSLIDQSLSALASAQTTNGDGFGIGWYDECEFPGVYKHIRPAWNDPNLKDVCIHTKSPMFLAHVRAATATSIQQTNCHPFRHGRWLFVHNGVIRDYRLLRREIALAINEDLFPDILGTTDSELMFYLALHFGMNDNVYEGVARMVGFIEDIGSRRGIEFPMQMTLGISDGERIYAFRYSTEHDSRTLFHSRAIPALRQLVPAEFHDRVDGYSEDAITVVSEPFVDLPDMWEEIPESTLLTVQDGRIECRDFTPIRS